jgi:hypothetical protein
MTTRKCMNDGMLTSYLDGSLKAPARVEAERHLIDCDACRGQLAYFMRILEEDVEPEEETILEAAMQSWDRLVPPVEAGRRSRMRGWMAIAASVLIAAGIGALFYSLEPTVPDDDEVIELIVLNRSTRDFESRLSLFDSGSRYRPFVALRSIPDAADLQGVLEEEDTDGEAPSNHTRGVASLVRRDFDRAVEFLELAIIESGSAAVRNDLGVAYLEGNWSTAEQQAAYLVRARNQFEMAVRLEPDSPTAIFNLVLWFERAELLTEMREEAGRYLELDSDSGWADEVRSILDRSE